MSNFTKVFFGRRPATMKKQVRFPGVWGGVVTVSGLLPVGRPVRLVRVVARQSEK
jgi:hypothetical protein